MRDQSARIEFNIFPWNPAFETKIAIIDDQHRHLARLLNQFANECLNATKFGEAERLLDTLIDYVDHHFETEQALWAQLLITDPLLNEHLQARSGFTDKVRSIHSRFKTDDRHKVIGDLLLFLSGWLAQHILAEDKFFSLIFFQLQAGVEACAAEQQAYKDMAKQTSGLIQNALLINKELSSRLLTLQREMFSHHAAEQPLLDQTLVWDSEPEASNDSVWDLTVQDVELLTADQFIQKGLTVHPDDWPALQQNLLEHISSQSDIFIHQHRVIDTAGSERWVQALGKTIKLNSAGQQKRIIGTQTDITDRKMTELTLQRERDFRRLINQFATDFMASSAEDFDCAIMRALQRSGEYMRADRTYVFLVSADGQRMSNTHEWCAAGIEPEIDNLQRIPSSALSWWWSQFRDVGYVLVPRVSDMPAEAKNEYKILESQGIQSVCVYPLHMGTELVGFMGSDSVREERHWGEDVIEFLSLMSDLLGIALEHRQLHQKRAQLINQLERAEQQACLGHWHLDYASGKVIWSKEMSRIFERDINTFAFSAKAYLELVHPDDRASTHLAYMNAKAASSDLRLEHRIMLNGGKIKHLEVRGRFDSTSEKIIEGTVQDVTEKAQHRESLQRLAFQDSLTGLPNRRSIEDTLLREMDYCEQHDRYLVLALIDLDNFRETNDQYGATFGDALLKALAQRIKRLFNNKTSVVARVGGDEFIVLLSRLKSKESYINDLNQLLTAINKPLTIEAVTVFLTASIGVTEFPQPRPVLGEQLVRQAQQSLFQAKMLGKARLQKYDINLEHDTRSQTDYLEQIRKALHAGEFVLYYQPKVHLKTDIVFGVEALLRWQKNADELVLPSEFLPALLNHPLEIELGDWVIREALAQMRLWKKQGLEIQVSVNVSSLQLFDDAFVETLSKNLNEYPDITPSALQLEVLESSMLSDLDAVSDVMHQSRQLGVSFALDDFGTGYSSLSYLKHLPASVLKIDQSFVREMLESTDDLSIITGVIGMAKAFAMEVIAEGVEDVEQASLLLRLGCKQAQGFGVARPMPADELPDWIRQWSAAPSWIQQLPSEADQDLTLLYAEVEHRCWIKGLERWLRDEGDAVPVLDHHLCKTGIWIDNDARSRFGHCLKFSHLVYIHQDLHNLGKKAVSMHSKGELEDAFMLLEKIKQKHELFLQELRSLIE